MAGDDFNMDASEYSQACSRCEMIDCKCPDRSIKQEDRRSNFESSRGLQRRDSQFANSAYANPDARNTSGMLFLFKYL